VTNNDLGNSLSSPDPSASIREIQDLLGHKNVETTMIYTHVMRDMAQAPRSPLDLLLMKGENGAGSAGK